MAEENSLPFSGEQVPEGGRAGSAASSFGPGQPSGVGQAPAARTDRVGVAGVGRLFASLAATLTGAQGGRAGITQGTSSTALEDASGLFDRFLLDQLDSELGTSLVAHKQLLQKSNIITCVLQEKQAVIRARDDLFVKNKEMSLKMEKLQCENMELSLKNKEQALEIENLKKTLAERELVRTRSLTNGQAYEGGTSNNVPQEELFDPDQQERVIFENHEKQRELTETRKKLKDVFTNMGHDDEDDSVIGIKRLGEINIKPFYRDPCSNAKAAKKCSWWQQKIESHSWRPFKGITIKGRYEEVLDEEDETLKELKACGPDIYGAVVEALMEMEKYNSSGRTLVPELWNYKEGRMATTVECIDFLSRKVMGLKPECSKRRRTSPRFR